MKTAFLTPLASAAALLIGTAASAQETFKVGIVSFLSGQAAESFGIPAVNGAKVLLECGMHQGRRQEEDQNRSAFPFDPSSLDAVVISHAHLDHSGLLPRLVATLLLLLGATTVLRAHSWRDALSLALASGCQPPSAPAPADGGNAGGNRRNHRRGRRFAGTDQRGRSGRIVAG